MKLGSVTLAAAAILLANASASAQSESSIDDGAAEAPPPVEEVAEEEPAVVEEEPAVADEASPEVDESSLDSGGADDGARFRFGVAGGFGGMIIEGYGFMYTGMDLKLGAQINDLVAVYAVPQLGGYWGDVGGLVGSGGLVGISGVVDFTFVDRIFVGGGLGWAVLNNPSGLELHFRAGGYPVMSRSKEKPRRKGLMVGVDFRVHIVSQGGASATAISPVVNIGYEAF